METQSDQKIRVVALSNLRAMCERVSGTCHRYEVTTVSRSRVHVEYSNPDEYGYEHPMTAVFPCYPQNGASGFEGLPNVILDILRVLHDTDDGEGWQRFQPLLDYPTLWRSLVVEHPGVPNRWQTHAEIREAGQDQWLKIDPTHDSCTVCDLPVAYEARCNACGWKERHSIKQFKNVADVVEYDKASHACPPYRYETGGQPVELTRTPDVTVRAITRSEVN